ncbi:Ribosomal protein [Parasponia andersonii]|uniref:Ribosomal protein n=1 Tax=Parasponia andersonii TaxID=3476 RepID=A0A2P5A7X2_PARAD|nr:Ribosomal protein [Parasponia andersonii]
MSEESKSRGGGAGVSATSDLESQYYYGTFQGIPNAYPPPPQPVVGFPQPLPPPGATGHPRYPHTHYPPPHPHHHHHGYQTDPGYAVVEGHPVRLHRLPCCGLGLGWFL